MILQDLVIKSRQLYPERLAIVGPDSRMTYGQLDDLANQAARALQTLGVSKGDRVALWLNKSSVCVALMQAILRLGAAYVPIDPKAPALRVRTIISDCKVKAFVTTAARAEEVLTEELADVPCIITEGEWKNSNWQFVESFSNEALESVELSENDLAYILYTSGSTGQPKGVCISHKNALAFIEWSAEILKASPEDRFSNHAPFNFDLSVLDLYVAFCVGGSVWLIPELIAYSAQRLVDFIAENQITIWYSVPSALILMMDQGKFLDLADIATKIIIFAGEPFPIKHLRRMREQWPHMRLLNFYGPTETNVCTYYEVEKIEEHRILPVPIGKASCGNTVWAVRPDGIVAGVDEEGELMVSGPTVMLGYWGQPPQAEVYPTGDIVSLQKNGNYLYLARRDHMVKVRGHRIELGEIEAVLMTHPNVEQVAVTVSGTGLEARLVAHVVSKTAPPPSLLSLKELCAKWLPIYMIIDKVVYDTALPRTNTGKIDRKKLFEELSKD